MENASKALLIAGAILLVIALIAIGMAILNMGNDTTEQVAGNMNTLAVQAYNQTVTPYLDKELSATAFGNLRSAAAALGMNVTDTYNTLTANGTRDIEVIATKYVTAADVTGGQDNPLTGEDYTKEDIGKIVGITVYQRGTATVVGGPYDAY